MVLYFIIPLFLRPRQARTAARECPLCAFYNGNDLWGRLPVPTHSSGSWNASQNRASTKNLRMGHSPAAPRGKLFSDRPDSFRFFTPQTNEALFFGRNHQVFCASSHPRRIIPAPLGILFQGSNASRFKRFGKEMLYYQKFTMALSNCCLK